MQTIVQFNSSHDRVDNADYGSSIATMIELMMRTMFKSYHDVMDWTDNGTVQ